MKQSTILICGSFAATLVADARGEASSYKYQFRLDLSTPLVVDISSGKPNIEKCIGWDQNVSPTNFTWYGFSFQLPDDTQSVNGGWDTAPAQPLKEDGFVQLFNDTSKDFVAKFTFTTSTDSPIIRARINNGFIWDTFVFNFSHESNYAEETSVRFVDCIVEESDDGMSKTYFSVAQPTVTVSLERLSGPEPTPSPTSSSSVTSNFFAIAALGLTTLLLLL